MNPKDLVGAKKAPLGVVPPSLVPFVAPAMAVGANKYGPFNWRKQPVQAMTYIEAAERHILAWVDGQENAEDTGVHHLAHALAGLAILADAISADNLIDNRPSPGPTADILRDQDKSLASQVVYVDKPMAMMTSDCTECGFRLGDGHAIHCSHWPEGLGGA